MNPHIERFTKGEWVADESVMAAVNCGQKHIAMVNMFNDGTDRAVLKDECLANAHLISAAPNMYRTLRGVASQFCDENDEGLGEGYYTVNLTQAEVDAIRTALAKADGEV